MNRSDLHPYQRRMVEFIKEQSGCCLFVGLGLGKSVTTLTAIQDMFNAIEIEKVLIIAPLRVALNTWTDEIANWDHIDVSHTVIAGRSARDRELAVHEDTDVHIINRENTVWLVNLLKKKWHYDMVIIDESSSFKASSSKRFKALKKVLPYIDRVVGLTGTPATNGLLDLWSQVFLADRGKRLGKTYSGFRSRFFESDYMGYSWNLREGADVEIYDKLQDICLTLNAEDYLSVPDRIDNTLKVELPPSVRKQYKELEQEFILEMGKDTIEAVSAAVLVNKLLQVSNGAIYTADREVVELHTGKLDALEEIVEGSPAEPLLVAYNYKHDLSRILKRFPQAVVLDKDPKTIKRWNAGKIPMLVTQPQSAGHGLNLQHGGHNIVWFGLNWSLELYQQLNGRLIRQGQTKSVIVHHIVTTGTVDNVVIQALKSKDKTQKALLNALKDDIEINCN